MLGSEIQNMKKEMEQVSNESRSFAYELLLELKKRAKRDFIIIITELIIIILSNICWFVYTTDIDYAEDYDVITHEQENTNNSSMIGEIN